MNGGNHLVTMMALPSKTKPLVVFFHQGRLHFLRRHRSSSLIVDGKPQAPAYMHDKCDPVLMAGPLWPAAHGRPRACCARALVSYGGALTQPSSFGGSTPDSRVTTAWRAMGPSLVWPQRPPHDPVAVRARPHATHP